jgi:hypothetical protein
MKSLSKVEKKRILNLLEGITRDVASLKRKEASDVSKKSLKYLKDHKDLTNHYRRFVSPRKLTGRVVDKMKNKFYYETEYFIGEIFARQERFNNEVISYLKYLDKEVKSLKKNHRRRK